MTNQFGYKELKVALGVVAGGAAIDHQLRSVEEDGGVIAAFLPEQFGNFEEKASLVRIRQRRQGVPPILR